jgi:hypothetical protein
LEQLQKLELYGINSYNVRLLSHLPSVDSLSLGLTRDATSSFCRLDVQVRGRLKLHGHLDILQVLPGDNLRAVKDLTLEINTPLTEDDMVEMRNLRELLRLRLHFHVDKRPGGNKLKFDANDGLLPELQVLHITSERAPLHVEFAPRALPKLEVLSCVGSLGFARGLRDVLPSLKEVSFDKDLGRQMRAILEGHPNKPALKETRGWCRYDRRN